MSPLVPVLLLLGFFAALTAYWCWSRAKESAVDADLQQRLWNHSKYQREYKDHTPQQVAEWLKTEKTKYTRYAALLALIALGCFAYAAVNLGKMS